MKKLLDIKTLSLFALAILVFPFSVYSSEKVKIAVLDMEAIGVHENMARTTSEFLRTELFKTGYFDLLERSKLDKVFSEHKMQFDGSISDEEALKAGRLLAVKYLVVGSLNKLGSNFFLNIRLVDIEMGKVAIADLIKVNSEDGLFEATQQLSAKISKMSPIRGRVVRVNGNTAHVSLGRDDRVTNGMLLRVQRLGEIFKDRDGRVLGREIVEVGTLRVDKVISRDISRTMVIERHGQLEQGNIVVIWAGGKGMPHPDPFPPTEVEAPTEPPVDVIKGTGETPYPGGNSKPPDKEEPVMIPFPSF